MYLYITCIYIVSTLIHREKFQMDHLQIVLQEKHQQKRMIIERKRHLLKLLKNLQV